MTITTKRILVAAAALALMVPVAATAQHHGHGWRGHRGPGGPGGPAGHGHDCGPGCEPEGAPRFGAEGLHGRHPGAMMLLHGVLARLDLEDAQRDQIHALAEARREAAEGLRSDLDERRGALHEAMRAEEPDEAGIRAAVLAVAEVEAELAVDAARLLSEVRAVLTPEQREQARELLDRGREWRQRRPERWRPGR